MSMGESMDKQENLEELAKQRYLKKLRKQKRQKEAEEELAQRVARGEKITLSTIQNNTDGMGYMKREDIDDDSVDIKADAPLLVRFILKIKLSLLKLVRIFNPPDHIFIDMLARAFNGEELAADHQVENPYTGLSKLYYDLAVKRQRISETEHFKILLRLQFVWLVFSLAHRPIVV